MGERAMEIIPPERLGTGKDGERSDLLNTQRPVKVMSRHRPKTATFPFTAAGDIKKARSELLLVLSTTGVHICAGSLWIN